MRAAEGSWHSSVPLGNGGAVDLHGGLFDQQSSRGNCIMMLDSISFSSSQNQGFTVSCVLLSKAFQAMTKSNLEAGILLLFQSWYLGRTLGVMKVGRVCKQTRLSEEYGIPTNEW